MKNHTRRVITFDFWAGGGSAPLQRCSAEDWARIVRYGTGLSRAEHEALQRWDASGACGHWSSRRTFSYGTAAGRPVLTLRRERASAEVRP